MFDWINREFIIIFSGMLFIVGILSLAIWSTNRDRKKRWAISAPEKAQKMYYHGTDITPNRGDFFVRVSEFQWVNIFWDKEENYLMIQRPPKIYHHMKENPIYEREKNWRVVREAQPKKTTIEEYMKRQVM